MLEKLFENSFVEYKKREMQNCYGFNVVNNSVIRGLITKVSQTVYFIISDSR